MKTINGKVYKSADEQYDELRESLFPANLTDKQIIVAYHKILRQIERSSHCPFCGAGPGWHDQGCQFAGVLSPEGYQSHTEMTGGCAFDLLLIEPISAKVTGITVIF